MQSSWEIRKNEALKYSRIERINQKLIMDGLNPDEFKDFMDGKHVNTEIKKPMNLFFRNEKST